MSLGIGWTASCHVALDYSFPHSMSLACFLPRAFVFLSWLGTSFHFVITCLMLWDMFIDHDHLFTLYTYHGPSTPFFVQSLIQFSTRCSYFHYRKVKDSFSYSHLFREICLDHLITFFLWSSSWRLNQGYFGLDLGIDLVLVLFFTPHSFSSHIDHFLDHRYKFFSHICSCLTLDTHVTRVSIVHPDFLLSPYDCVSHPVMYWVVVYHALVIVRCIPCRCMSRV